MSRLSTTQFLKTCEEISGILRRANEHRERDEHPLLLEFGGSGNAGNFTSVAVSSGNFSL